MEQNERFKQITLLRLETTISYYLDNKFGVFIKDTRLDELKKVIVDEIIHFENSDRDVLDYERVFKKQFVKNSGSNES